MLQRKEFGIKFGIVSAPQCPQVCEPQQFCKTAATHSQDKQRVLDRSWDAEWEWRLFCKLIISRNWCYRGPDTTQVEKASSGICLTRWDKAQANNSQLAAGCVRTMSPLQIPNHYILIRGQTFMTGGHWCACGANKFESLPNKKLIISFSAKRV